jgi:hypothetical protein
LITKEKILTLTITKANYKTLVSILDSAFSTLDTLTDRVKSLRDVYEDDVILVQKLKKLLQDMQVVVNDRMPEDDHEETLEEYLSDPINEIAFREEMAYRNGDD